MPGSFHIALTGHRPGKLAGYDLAAPYYARLQAHLEAIIANGLDHHAHLTLHSGMALGADAVWTRAVLKMRAQHTDRIRFVAEVPFMAQPDRWPDARDRDQWAEHVAAADQVNVYAPAYSNKALFDRNNGMVDAAQLLLAVHDGSTTGGTAGAVAYAGRKRVRVFSLHPDLFR